MQPLDRKGFGSLSRDTELLTPKGWMNITEVTMETLVAQYSIDGFITFAKPVCLNTKLTQKAIQLYNKGGHYNQIVAPHQIIPYVYLTKKAIKLKISKAETLKTNSTRRYLNTGIVSSKSNKGLTSREKLQIVFQADGFFGYRGKKNDAINFSFSRDRKIDRFNSILKEAKIDYTVRYYGDKTHYYFKAPKDCYDKNFDWVDLSTVSLQWCRDFIEEVSHWDSHIFERPHFYCQYANIKKIAIDRVQAVATLAGYRTCSSIQYDESNTQNTCYRLSILGNSKSIKGDVLVKNLIDYNDYMYQVITETGFLIIRRNNCVSICGCRNYLYGEDSVLRLYCNDLV